MNPEQDLAKRWSSLVLESLVWPIADSKPPQKARIVIKFVNHWTRSHSRWENEYDTYWKARHYPESQRTGEGYVRCPVCKELRRALVIHLSEYEFLKAELECGHTRDFEAEKEE